MKVEEIETSRIIPYANNPRHNDQAVSAVAASIKEFGFRQPIVTDEELVVLVGHTRLKAAQSIGLSVVPVHIAEGLTEAQKKAYRIADNRLNELAEWDNELLSLELEALTEADFDIGLLGFSDEELDELLDKSTGTEGNTDPDEVPEVPENPVTKLGDVWLLGEHRLMCGDSTDKESVGRLMAGEMAALVVTDPPYGVSYADKNSFLNDIDKGNHNQTAIANDHLSKEDIQAMWESAFREMANAMSPGAVVYCFMPQGGDQMMMMMMMMMEGAGIEPRHELIWLKNNHVLGRTDYAYKHEPVLYAWKPGAGHKFYGDFQTSILEFARPQKSDIHPTMKPIPLVVRLIENSSKRNELLYEPFSGSGTTLIASEQTRRRCYAMEISPQYVDVAIKRWQDFTGKKAILERTGEEFDAIVGASISDETVIK